MSHWGFVFEQLTHEDARLREERRRRANRKRAAGASRQRARSARDDADRGDGLQQ